MMMMIEKKWNGFISLTTWLYLITLCLAKLECDSEAVRQIHSSEVKSHYIHIGESFDKLIEGGQDTREWWHSAAIPNTGNLTFNDTFVIIGLTTQGEYWPGYTYEDAYVSQFSLLYTDSLDNPYDIDEKKVFEVASPVERFFYFSEPITVKAMELTILNGRLGGPVFNYWWYMDLIGCLESEATEVYLCSNETEADLLPITETAANITPCTVNYTVTVTTSCSDCHLSSQNDRVVSVAANNASGSVLPSQPASAESCNFQLIVAIVPSAVLLILLYVTIMGWIVFAKLSRKKVVADSSSSRNMYLSEFKNNTLRNLRNAPLYDKSISPMSELTLNSPLSIDSYNRDGGMVYNGLYSFRQSQDSGHSEADLLLHATSRGAGGDHTPSISQQGESIYTEVDEVYTSIKPSDSDITTESDDNSATNATITAATTTTTTTIDAVSTGIAEATTPDPSTDGDGINVRMTDNIAYNKHQKK